MTFSHVCVCSNVSALSLLSRKMAKILEQTFGDSLVATKFLKQKCWSNLESPNVKSQKNDTFPLKLHITKKCSGWLSPRIYRSLVYISGPNVLSYSLSQRKIQMAVLSVRQSVHPVFVLKRVGIVFSVLVRSLKERNRKLKKKFAIVTSQALTCKKLPFEW